MFINRVQFIFYIVHSATIILVIMVIMIIDGMDIEPFLKMYPRFNLL